MSLCVARRSRQAKNCCSCRGHEADQSASSQIKPNQGSHQRKYENCHPPLRPSRPLRETNFTHPHQTGPKRSKPHLFADNFRRSCRGHEAVRCQIPRPGSRGHEAGQSASSQIKPGGGRLIGSQLFSRILTVSHERCTNSHRFSMSLTKSHYFSLILTPILIS